MVAYRKKKSLRNFLIGSHIAPEKKDHQQVETTPCNSCRKTCHLINYHVKEKFTNILNGNQVIIKKGGNCKTSNIVYAARCKVHSSVYIGQSGKELRERFSKHRYDFKHRPENNDLATHFRNFDHSFEDDLEITILDQGFRNENERKRREDEIICLLGTKHPDGLNCDLGPYAREMYETYQRMAK